MNSSQRLLIAIALSAIATCATRAAPVDLGVVAVTDMTPAGRKAPQATPDFPIYYQAVTTGFKAFGRAIAGDKEPPNDEFLQIVLRTLKREGYVPSTEENPASLVLGFAWGSLRGDFGGALRYLGGEKMDLMWETQNSGHLDARVLLRGLRSEKADRIMETANEDLYVVTIAAYDRQALVEGDLVELWQTRISCPTRGVWAMDALPEIVQAAGPVIGRETDTPEIFVVDEAFRNRRTDVSFGALTTLDEDFDLEEIDLLDLTKEDAE